MEAQEPWFPFKTFPPAGSTPGSSMVTRPPGSPPTRRDCPVLSPEGESRGSSRRLLVAGYCKAWAARS